jgi:hypothetical protein
LVEQIIESGQCTNHYNRKRYFENIETERERAREYRVMHRDEINRKQRDSKALKKEPIKQAKYNKLLGNECEFFDKSSGECIPTEA